MNEIMEKKPKYICLKLNKKINFLELDIRLYNWGRKNVDLRDNSKNNVTWRDITEILLKADGSWDKKPYFYNKYEVKKFGGKLNE